MNDSSFKDDSTIEDFMNYNNSYVSKNDVSLSDQLAGFERLRISALTKAAEISPYVKQVTIGPKSPIKKEEPEEPEPPQEEIIKVELLLEDKLREDLRYTLLIKEYETKFQQASEEIFKSLLENMGFKHKETMQKCLQRHNEQQKKKLIEMRNVQLQQLKEMLANDNLSILENAKLDQQRSQMMNKQRIEDMNKALEEQNIAKARFAAITDSNMKIYNCLNEISDILATDPHSQHVYEKYMTSINAVVSNISAIMEMCGPEKSTDKEVKQAEVLAINITNIKIKIIEDLNKIKQDEKDKQAELLKQQENEKKHEEELKAAQQLQAQQAAEQASKAPPMFYTSENIKYYEELKNYREQYEAQYKDLLENASLKKFRFDCQKAVNTPVNALSSVGGSHMRDKFDKLSKLLKGERVQVLDTYVTTSQHPQATAYCTALLAKKIVRQGDLLVSSKPEAAYPLAAITVALWSQFPDLGKLLEAYFHQMCPYLVPMFLPQKEGQTDKEFYLSRGYTYNEDGVVEKHDKFLKRMSGIFMLRCAIWTAKTPRFLNTNNPHGLQYAWKWLASFVNLKPEPDICATLLHDFFKACGAEFLKQYRKQFIKIIKLVSTDYLAILQNIDEGGPKTRLEVFLQNVLKTGFIEAPVGQLEPNSW